MRRRAYASAHGVTAARRGRSAVRPAGAGDRFGGGRDRFGGGRERFGGSRDRFGGGRDRFGGGRDRRLRLEACDELTATLWCGPMFPCWLPRPFGCGSSRLDAGRRGA